MYPWMGDSNQGIAILRVSSHRQKDNISHDVQEREIRDYCERHGIVLVHVHKIVESAKDNENRKKYSAAIAQALTERYRHILFYMFDREARNQTDAEQNEKYVRADLIVLHYVQPKKVFWKETPGTDFFMREIETASNKHFIRNHTEKVVSAMKQKAEDGWFPSNNVPLGYMTQKRRDAEGNEMRRGTIIVPTDNEKELAWVRLEFALRAQGLSYPEVRRRVAASGLLTEKQVRSYHFSAIEYRIKNCFYGGDFIWQGMRYKGRHELIISPAILEAVKKVERGNRGLRLVSGHGIFGGGWMKCAECGCQITYDPKRKIYRNGKEQAFHYYRCSNGRGFHTEKRVYVREDAILEQFEALVERISMDGETARFVAAALNEAEKRATIESKRAIAKLQTDVDSIMAKEDRAYQDLTAGTIDAEMFKRLVNQYRAERTAIQARLDAAKVQASGKSRENVASVIELATNARSLFKTRNGLEKRDFLETLVSNPRLRGATVEYDIKKAWGVLICLRESFGVVAQAGRFPNRKTD
jgi:site-specific DNA recombinase